MFRQLQEGVTCVVEHVELRENVSNVILRM